MVEELVGQACRAGFSETCLLRLGGRIAGNPPLRSDSDVG